MIFKSVPLCQNMSRYVPQFKFFVESTTDNLTQSSNDNLTNNLTPKELLQRLTEELDNLTDEELEEMFEDIKFFLFKYLDKRDWDLSDLTFYVLKDADKKRVMDAFRGILDGLAVQINHGKLSRSNLFEIKQSIQLFWSILKKAFKSQKEQKFQIK